jgi:hypothetical protein
MQQIELDPDHYDKLARIAKAIDWPIAEVLLAVLSICDSIPMDYAEFEEKLRQLELDVKLLLADCRERNARMEVIAQMMRTDFALQRD